MESPHSLISIPVEVAAMVGEVCDTSTLLALRLTSRHLRAVVQDTFINRHFRKRSHLFTVFGLHSLATITAEADLVKHLHTIEVVRMAPDRYRPVHDKAQIDWWQGQMDALASVAEELFAQILANISRAGRGVRFLLTAGSTSTGESVAPYGASFIESAPLVRENAGESGIPCPATALFGASERQSAMITELDLGHANRDGYLVFWNFMMFIGQLSSAQSSRWHHLKVLKLDLGEQYVSCWEDDHFAGLDKLLRAAYNLEDMFLLMEGGQYFANEENDDALMSLGHAFASSSVRKLEFNGMCNASADAILVFLSRFPTTLRSLCLISVGLRSFESWPQVLRTLAERRQLSSFKVANISTVTFDTQRYGGETHMAYFGEKTNKQWSAEGTEAVTEGLRDLARQIKFLEPTNWPQA